jgi:hypothetical protein
MCILGVMDNPDIYPSDEVLAAVLGRAMPAFTAMQQRATEALPSMEFRWRFYTDGKKWLMRAMKKKSTVFWVGTGKGLFHITFYLGAAMAPKIAASSLPTKLKRTYALTVGKSFRSITLDIRKIDDLKPLGELLRLKG